MTEGLEYLTSPQGMPVISAGACVIFLGLIVAAILARRINLGSAIPRIDQAQNPRAYWFVLSVYGAIAIWMGCTALYGLLAR
jgi:hypothetical protein